MCSNSVLIGQVLPGDESPVVLAQSLVPAGFPSPAQEQPEQHINISEELISHPHATFMVEVGGDSMVMRGIVNGDRILVDRSLTPHEGDVVVALIDGEFTVKTLSLKDKLLLPANTLYQPIDMTQGEVILWGVVTTCIHRFR